MCASTIRFCSAGTISISTSRGPITAPGVKTRRPTISPAIGAVMRWRSAASREGRIRSSRSKSRAVVSFSSSAAVCAYWLRTERMRSSSSVARWRACEACARCSPYFASYSATARSRVMIRVFCT